MPDQITDGDLNVDNITNHAVGTYQSRNGSVIVSHKIDDHSNVVIIAAKDVQIGEKIDQHSQADIRAGGSVSIGQKIDQHSVALIAADSGNVWIGQKIDQHSWARIRVPNGALMLGQGLDQHSHLHYQARTSSIPSTDGGSSVDGDMNATWDPSESGPNS
ncbi:MAG TPA: hypothetical protein VFO25_08295 [Candidatus Eremiobacteraceae bacterium]|nr:hypothetical protein [Candidatus Eremiobacteraceae bacterium]